VVIAVLLVVIGAGRLIYLNCMMMHGLANFEFVKYLYGNRTDSQEALYILQMCSHPHTVLMITSSVKPSTPTFPISAVSDLTFSQNMLYENSLICGVCFCQEIQNQIVIRLFK